jgi:hypothetical protein
MLIFLFENRGKKEGNNIICQVLCPYQMQEIIIEYERTVKGEMRIAG